MRIQQSYANAAGASGGLLALALIGFIFLVGLISFSAWPQSHGVPVSPLDSSLPPAKAPQREVERSLRSAAALQPSLPVSQAVTASPTRSVTSPSAGGGAGHRRPGGHRGHPVQKTPALPGPSPAQTVDGPGRSENAPGHLKGSASGNQGSGKGNGPRQADRVGDSHGPASFAGGPGNGHGHAYGHSKPR